LKFRITSAGTYDYFNKYHENIFGKACILKYISYICTRFKGIELIEEVKEIGFRLSEEGTEGDESRKKYLNFFGLKGKIY